MKRGNDKGNTEESAERRYKAFEYRKAGASYRAIGRALDISEAQAHRDIQKVLAHLSLLETTAAEELQRIELERLDGMLLKMYPMATSGNMGAVDRVLRIMERRAKLLGLDAPERKEISGEIGIKGYTTKEVSPDAWDDTTTE